MSSNTFEARGELEVGRRRLEIFRLDALQPRFDVARLPFSLKILLENLLRTEARRRRGGATSRRWPAGTPRPSPTQEIAFTPARVLMQDFTGVPAIVDLAAMRDAIAAMGGDPAQINPLVPVELVIDHSVQVDAFGTARRLPAQRRARVRAQRRSATRSCAGARRRSTTSRSCRRTPASCTRSTSSTWRASCSSTRTAGAPIPTRWSAPTRTRRWSTAWASSAGAWAGSRPRPRCSASRCRC